MTQPKALRLADALEMSSNHGIRREAAAELRCLEAENEALRKTLAASCNEERQQMWEASPGGGCSRALSAEFQRDALLEALKKIAAIGNKMWGTDWEEIDEARGIARAAIKAAEENT